MVGWRVSRRSRRADTSKRLPERIHLRNNVVEVRCPRQRHNIRPVDSRELPRQLCKRDPIISASSLTPAFQRFILHQLQVPALDLRRVPFAVHDNLYDDMAPAALAKHRATAAVIPALGIVHAHGAAQVEGGGAVHPSPAPSSTAALANRLTAAKNAGSVVLRRLSWAIVRKLGKNGSSPNSGQQSSQNQVAPSGLKSS